MGIGKCLEMEKKEKTPSRIPNSHDRTGYNRCKQGNGYYRRIFRQSKLFYKHFCEGNHDDWLNRFNEEHPYLNISVKTAINLEDRGYTYHPIGKYLKIGKLHFYHGHHYGGMYHSKNHLMRLGVNIMYGHWHDLQQMSITHMDGQKSAWSIGCLKDMGDSRNAWLGNRKHNWSHAFSIVDFFESGYFTVHVIQIIKGKTSLWGEIIDGN